MVFALAFALLNAGCGKPDAPSTIIEPAVGLSISNPQPATTAFLKLHWLGKKQLADDVSATNFLAIWNLPESLKLEAQTLDKLATAPWRLSVTNNPLATAPTALLRPLLDDLVREETQLELYSDSNAVKELVLAIRLPADRAALWQANLPVVLKSIWNSLVISNAANFQAVASNAVVTMSQSKEWTVLAVRWGAASSNLLSSAVRRVAWEHQEQLSATNDWLKLEADVNAILPHLKRQTAFPNSPLLTNLPHISLRVFGEAGNVRTLAKITFPVPLPLTLKPWNIPTNIIHDPLSGFMALRGIRPLLKTLGWDEGRFGESPDQFYAWAQAGNAPLHFFAIPSTSASNQVALLGNYLLDVVNPAMVNGASVQSIPAGAFERVTNLARIRWRGLPMLSPELDWVPNGENPFVVGSLFGNRLTNRPAPDSLLQQLVADSNLILYDWEHSQLAEYRLIQAGQLTRFVFGRARLSITNNPGLPWLVAISPKLGVAGSSLRLTEPQQLSFSRQSTIGLTAWETHLFVEWLESPEFPKGLFTLLSPKPPAIGSNLPPNPPR